MELDAIRLDLRPRAPVSPQTVDIAHLKGRDPTVMPALVELRDRLVEDRRVVGVDRGGQGGGACDEPEREEEVGELHVYIVLVLVLILVITIVEVVFGKRN